MAHSKRRQKNAVYAHPYINVTIIFDAFVAITVCTNIVIFIVSVVVTIGVLNRSAFNLPSLAFLLRQGTYHIFPPHLPPTVPHRTFVPHVFDSWQVRLLILEFRWAMALCNPLQIHYRHRNQCWQGFISCRGYGVPSDVPMNTRTQQQYPSLRIFVPINMTCHYEYSYLTILPVYENIRTDQYYPSLRISVPTHILSTRMRLTSIRGCACSLPQVFVRASVRP